MLVEFYSLGRLFMPILDCHLEFILLNDFKASGSFGLGIAFFFSLILDKNPIFWKSWLSNFDLILENIFEYIPDNVFNSVLLKWYLFRDLSQVYRLWLEFVLFLSRCERLKLELRLSKFDQNVVEASFQLKSIDAFSSSQILFFFRKSRTWIFLLFLISLFRSTINLNKCNSKLQKLKRYEVIINQKYV